MAWWLCAVTRTRSGRALALRGEGEREERVGDGVRLPGAGRPPDEGEGLGEGAAEGAALPVVEEVGAARAGFEVGVGRTGRRVRRVRRRAETWRLAGHGAVGDEGAHVVGAVARLPRAQAPQRAEGLFGVEVGVRLVDDARRGEIDGLDEALEVAGLDAHLGARRRRRDREEVDGAARSERRLRVAEQLAVFVGDELRGVVGVGEHEAEVVGGALRVDGVGGRVEDEGGDLRERSPPLRRTATSSAAVAVPPLRSSAWRKTRPASASNRDARSPGGAVWRCLRSSSAVASSSTVKVPRLSRSRSVVASTGATGSKRRVR